MPVIIPAFNNPTYVHNMIAQLLSRGFRNIIVIDNCSTAPKMQECFRRAKTVVQLTENRGPHYFFSDDRMFDALPNLFCITDPDLEFNSRLPENFLFQLIALTEEFQIGKVGLSLKISDHRKMLKSDFRNGSVVNKVWEWEAQFWKDHIASTLLGDPIYRADIDMTFAVYNKKYYHRGSHEALRVAGRYTCRHLPWYRKNGIPKCEAAYYEATQKFSTYFSPMPGPNAMPSAILRGLTALAAARTNFVRKNIRQMRNGF